MKGNKEVDWEQQRILHNLAKNPMQRGATSVRRSPAKNLQRQRPFFLFRCPEGLAVPISYLQEDPGRGWYFWSEGVSKGPRVPFVHLFRLLHFGGQWSPRLLSQQANKQVMYLTAQKLSERAGTLHNSRKDTSGSV